MFSRSKDVKKLISKSFLNEETKVKYLGNYESKFERFKY